MHAFRVRSQKMHITQQQKSQPTKQNNIRNYRESSEMATIKSHMIETLHRFSTFDASQSSTTMQSKRNRTVLFLFFGMEFDFASLSHLLKKKNQVQTLSQCSAHYIVS